MICCTCKKNKLPSDFYKAKPTTVRGSCRECFRVKERARYAKANAYRPKAKRYRSANPFIGGIDKVAREILATNPFWTEVYE